MEISEELFCDCRINALKVVRQVAKVAADLLEESAHGDIER